MPGGVRLELALLAAGWGEARREAVLRRESGALWFGVDLLDAPEDVDVDWSAVRAAFAAFSLWLAPARAGWPVQAEGSVEGEGLRLRWAGEGLVGGSRKHDLMGQDGGSRRRDPVGATGGDLGLTVPTWVGEARARMAAAMATVDGGEVPVCRLAEERLADVPRS